MTLYQVLTLAATLGIPTGLIGFLWGRVREMHQDSLAVREGVQALVHDFDCHYF